ncbi:MAG: RNA methyltransferase [Desulfamplus sp.]|nr:RNA methyltransferase [Desulfamplus sp.]
MNKSNLCVILVEPQGPLNIGSVCRVMMNFGFSVLRLVNPCHGYRSMDARKMALGALPILDNAGIFTSLTQALGDSHMAFGTTRRFGRYRKNFHTPEAAAGMMADMDDTIRPALVLGREDNGLDTKELSLCQHFITIPTDEAFPSMNLSHSLAVLLHEISKAAGKKKCPGAGSPGAGSPGTGSQGTGSQGTGSPGAGSPGAIPLKKPASIENIEQMYEHMQKTLCDIEFLDSQNPDHLMHTFRRLFGRAGLSQRDVRIIRGLMSKIEWVNTQRVKNEIDY